MIRKVLTEHKFLYLLCSLLAFFILNPILVSTQTEMYVFGILFSIVVFFSLFALRRGKLLVITAIILSALIITGYWSNHMLSMKLGMKKEVLTLEYLLIILFFSVISTIVLNHVMRDQYVNLNTLCGAICGYLLIALLWSFIYVLMYHLHRSDFRIPTTSDHSFESISQLFIYYSFSTQTTLGFGDIIPLSNLARTFSWLQAVTGQIYLTVWIAQLVGLHITNKIARKK